MRPIAFATFFAVEPTLCAGLLRAARGRRTAAALAAGTPPVLRACRTGRPSLSALWLGRVRAVTTAAKALRPRLTAATPRRMATAPALLATILPRSGPATATSMAL
jgi:hypothetical protein